ncbi:MAG: hypothetical protein IJ727_03720 [Treponema sp.]|nr:hypothetical protein [Treponema sp.]
MKIDNLEKFFEEVYKTSHLREMTATSFLKLLDGCIRSSLNNSGIDGNKLKELLSTKNDLFTKGVENSTDKSMKSPTKEFLSYKDENGNESNGFITDDKTRNIETLRNFAKSVDTPEKYALINKYKGIKVNDFYGIESVNDKFIGKCLTSIISINGKIEIK